MRVALFLVLVVWVCLVQVSVCAAYPLMPELPLALAAWAMIDGPVEGMLIRAWVVGFVYDRFDPASDVFHAVGYLVIALALLPIRNLLFRRRWAAWLGWTMVCSLALSWVDAWIGGAGDTDFMVAVAQALVTGVAAAAMGWLMVGIPRAWHPLGQGGA